MFGEYTGVLDFLGGLWRTAVWASGDWIWARAERLRIPFRGRRRVLVLGNILKIPDMNGGYRKEDVGFCSICRWLFEVESVRR